MLMSMPKESKHTEKYPCEICGKYFPSDQLTIMDGMWECCPACVEDIKRIIAQKAESK